MIKSYALDHGVHIKGKLRYINKHFTLYIWFIYDGQLIMKVEILYRSTKQYCYHASLSKQISGKENINSIRTRRNSKQNTN